MDQNEVRPYCSLEPRLSILDFVSQLWRKIGRRFFPKLRDKIWNGEPGFEANLTALSYDCLV